MTVTVYTQPSCMSCKLTQKHLDKLGIAYETASIDTILHTAKQYGITSAPVVAAGGKMWGGYRPDRLDALKSLA